MTVDTVVEWSAPDLAHGTAMSAFTVKDPGAGEAEEKLLGAWLIDAGRLKPEDVAAVLRVQREQHVRFGEAAVTLGFVSPADVAVALSRQFDRRYQRMNNQSFDAELVVACQPLGSQAEALRGLRSQLMLRWFDAAAKRKSLAVVSPARGEGRSFIAANLAVVFSQLGEHTLLIDADLRNPKQHSLFKTRNSDGLAALLSGRGRPDVIERIPGLVDLSVLPAGALPSNPQELLARPLFSLVLDELATEFDVIVIDTPASGDYADAQTIAARAGGALLVVHTDATPVRPAHELAQNIAAAGATVVGTVMNTF